MAEYSLTTHWKFHAALEKVWDEINAPLQWPGWWKGLEKVVEIEKGNEHGIGSLKEFTWKGFLPYTISFKMLTTEIQHMSRIEGVANGDLEGLGLWTLSSLGDFTLVRFDWNVRTTGTLMNMLALVAKPLFIRGHNRIMEKGRKGLVKKLSLQENK